MTELTRMVELTDAELDAVAAGQNFRQAGLVNVAANIEDVDVEVLNNADIAANVGVAVLGAIAQRATA